MKTILVVYRTLRENSMHVTSRLLLPLHPERGLLIGRRQLTVTSLKLHLALQLELEVKFESNSSHSLVFFSVS